MNLTTLVTNNNISINQSTATSTTNNKMTNLFDYLYANLNAKIKFRASDMILKMHSNGSCISASKSRS